MQSDKTVDIQAQIQLLSDLQARLQSLRHIPASLLKTPVPNALDLSAPMPRSEFQLVKEIGDIIRTEPIQDALRSARDSLRADGADLNPNLRRENRKRRWVFRNLLRFLMTMITWPGGHRRQSPQNLTFRLNAEARLCFRSRQITRQPSISRVFPLISGFSTAAIL